MAPALLYQVAFVFCSVTVMTLTLSHRFDNVVALPLPCRVTIVMPCYNCHAVLPSSSCLAYVIDATLPLLCGSASVIPHFIRHAALPSHHVILLLCHCHVASPLLYHVASVMRHCYHHNTFGAGVSGSVIQC